MPLLQEGRHVICDCRKKKFDDARKNQHPVTIQVTTDNASLSGEQPTPYDLLFSSDSEEEAVKQVVVTDKGSKA